jgi:hypothetical protein
MFATSLSGEDGSVGTLAAVMGLRKEGGHRARLQV